MAATKSHYGINCEKPYHKQEQTTQFSRNAKAFFSFSRRDKGANIQILNNVK